MIPHRVATPIHRSRTAPARLQRVRLRTGLAPAPRSGGGPLKVTALPPHMPVPVFASLERNPAVTRLKQRLREIRQITAALVGLTHGRALQGPIAPMVEREIHPTSTLLSHLLEHLCAERQRWSHRPDLTLKMDRSIQEAREAIERSRKA